MRRSGLRKMTSIDDKNSISEIRLHGEAIDPTAKGPFGVTDKEIQHIILLKLRECAKRRCAQMTLFRKVLRHFHISRGRKDHDQLLTNFLCNIKELKEENRISLTSGKTRLYIVLED